jgi:hypothetical protein
MSRRLSAVLLCVAAGCGAPTLAPEPTLRDAVVEFEGSVAEAESILSEPASSASDSDGESGEVITGTSPREVLQGVQTSAEELVRAANGHAVEGDVREIVAAAQSLAKKAEGNSPVSELAGGLQQLRAKAASLKERL